MCTSCFAERLNTEEILEKSQNWVDAKPSAQYPLQKQNFGHDNKKLSKDIFKLFGHVQFCFISLLCSLNFLRIVHLCVGYSKYIPIFISYAWLYPPGKIRYFWVFYIVKYIAWNSLKEKTWLVLPKLVYKPDKIMPDKRVEKFQKIWKLLDNDESIDKKIRIYSTTGKFNILQTTKCYR